MGPFELLPIKTTTEIFSYQKFSVNVDQFQRNLNFVSQIKLKELKIDDYRC